MRPAAPRQLLELLYADFNCSSSFHQSRTRRFVRFSTRSNPNTDKSEKPAGSVSGRVTIKSKGAAGIGVTLRRSESNPFENLQRAVSD